MRDDTENPLNVTSEDQPQDYLSGDTQNLLSRLVQQSARDAAFTANTLIESYRAERDTLAATLKAIRCEFAGAMNGPYAPSSSRLYDCLYPSSETIDEYRD